MWQAGGAVQEDVTSWIWACVMVLHGQRGYGSSAFVHRMGKRGSTSVVPANAAAPAGLRSLWHAGAWVDLI